MIPRGPILCLALIVAALPVEVAVHPILRARSATEASPLRTMLEERCSLNKIPGLAAVALRADSVIEIAAVGVRREGMPNQITPEDRFHIGSNVKAMTATLIAILIEQGKLSWETTPLDVFPEWKDKILPDYREVTLTNLLSHRAGIPAYEGATATLHTGSPGTFYAVVVLWPSRDLAIAVVANAGERRASKACTETLKAMAHRYDSR